MKKAIIVGGPTASGKTGLSIFLAKHYQTEIISCDSRQCYREMNIGVAKPSEQELTQAPHHFISSHSILEDVNAAVFENYALKKSSEIFQNHDQLVMVGGTGLYIRAFTDGMDAIPEIDPTIREQIKTDYQLKGMHWLQHCVQQEDPVYYQSGEILNPQRLMRALEVKRGSGKSIREFQKQQKADRDFDVIKLAIDIPRDELIQNINLRVDEMVINGLVEEVRSLIPYKELPPLKTVGYQEIFDFFDGKISLEEAIEQIKINTRQYAKRQVTWLKKHGFEWIDPKNKTAIIQLIESR
ncbi:MAG: tRNA (adenosine(37)-N6)-dimethylallyltransferase MiaA [Flavitalea sp.]